MRAGRYCPEHGNGYDDCSFIHGQRDRPAHQPLLSLISRDPANVNPDCVARDRPHAAHTLAGPGGNKSGASCAGLPACEPETAEEP